MMEIERLRIAVRRLTSLVHPGCSKIVLGWFTQGEIDKSENEFRENPPWAQEFDPTKEQE